MQTVRPDRSSSSQKYGKFWGKISPENKNSTSRNLKCFCCDQEGHFARDLNIYSAKDSKYEKCQKLGLYTRCCKTKPSQEHGRKSSNVRFRSGNRVSGKIRTLNYRPCSDTEDEQAFSVRNMKHCDKVNIEIEIRSKL